MTERCDALIIPADSPPSGATLKKAVLFFDSVTLANPADRALVNDREVVEHFDNTTVSWSSRNDFPRSPDYLDVMGRLLADTSSLQSRGIVRLTSAEPLPTLDAAMNYTVWHSAITSQHLVEAAAPDRHGQVKPPLGIGGYMRGGAITVNGYRSKYEITETRPAATIPDADEFWTLFAHLRLGRALKFLRQSNALGLSPLALDVPNQQILAASSEFGTLPTHQPVMGQQPLPPIQLDLEVLETEELLKALDEMSWNDVQKLRKHTLPGMNNLREHLRRSVKLQGKAHMLGIDDYQKELLKLHKDYQDAKEKAASEWEKLRIAAVGKLGGTVGAGVLADASGLLGTVIATPWVDLLVKIFASGLVATSALTKELQSLIPARRIVKQHPLYFVERLPSSKTR